MICESCGSEGPGEFCSNCGAVLDGTPTNPSSARKPGRIAAWKLLTGVLALGIAVVAAVAMLGSSSGGGKPTSLGTRRSSTTQPQPEMSTAPETSATPLTFAPETTTAPPTTARPILS